ncbi:MAG: hypothetical protein A2Y88_04285 [Chloroflexi bacterium RBG_13_48_10]|nr:MAG: hypothetical protein A2Y88_04285 [Chloroflexi bacterium RBG_13_48_10]
MITLLATIKLCRNKPGKKDLPFIERLVNLYPRAALAVEQLIKRGLLHGQDMDPGGYTLLSSSL